MKKPARTHLKGPVQKRSGAIPPQVCSGITVAEKCRDLFDHSHDLIQIFTPDGIFVEVNPSWRHILGYSGSDIRNLTFFGILHPNDKAECLSIFKKVLKTGKDRTMIATLVTKRGGEVRVEGVVSRLALPGAGRLLRAIFRDVTKKKQYEDLKNEFISTVSHELRTPLTVVREGVAQLQDGLLGEVPPDQKALLGMVLQNVDRLGNIISNLLNFSKLEAGQVRAHRSLCNMVEIAGDVVGNFSAVAQQRNLSLRTVSQKERIDLYIDRDMIAHLLNNLVSNALKFTSRGHIEIALSEQADFVECKVSDTGRGIAAEDLPRVFEKFRQLEREVGPGEKGTGLGLSISKKLVELHHGRIQVTSVPGQGTTVTFFLPKYTRRELFKEYIAEAMSKAFEAGNPLSIIILDIVDFDTLQRRVGERRLGEAVAAMEKIANRTLRRAADIAIKDNKAILVLLPDTKKEHAHIVLGRLYQVLEDCLAKVQKKPKIEIHSSVVCFPEDAETLEKILDKIYD